MKKHVLLAVLVCLLAACATPKVPQEFKVHFETSKGNFDVLLVRKHSPLAVDRFYALVKHKYFDGAWVYRGVPNFVAQFGGNGKKSVKKWDKKVLLDEPVLFGNAEGTISFARGGKDSRGTDVFINLRDNHRLDTLNYNDVVGFPAFGEVTQGMDVVKALYSGYSDSTMAHVDLLLEDPDAFLEKFPKLDQIKQARIVE